MKFLVKNPLNFETISKDIFFSRSEKDAIRQWNDIEVNANLRSATKRKRTIISIEKLRSKQRKEFAFEIISGIKI